MNFRSSSIIKYYFWVGVSLILIFTMLNPAGTSVAGLHIRFITWTINVSMLLVIMIRLHIVLQSMKIFNYFNPWVQLTTSGIIGSVIFVPLGLVVDYLFSLDDWSTVSSFQESLPIIFKEFGGVLFPATITWVAINAPRIIQLNFREIDEKTPEYTETREKEEKPVTKNTFMSIVPKEIGSDIIYLKSELHYIRVVTTKGERMVLFNLKDAIGDLEKTIEGIQTHRSYWVTVSHIKNMINDNNNKFILTSNDQKIPVSRRKSAEVKKFIQNRS